MKKCLDLATATIGRRQFVGLGLGVAAALGLGACSSEESGSSSSGSSDGEGEDNTVAIDATAFDALLAAGSVATDDVIASSEWATSVKEAGKLKVGGVPTSMLFSLLNETDNHLRGFDAGLFQLLARYVTGDESAYELTQVTSDTRESVLQNGTVDAVFATYSITDSRKEVISFAGPYFTTRQAILVLADNTDINGVEDLAGKTVAAQSGSTGPTILEEYAPEATIQEFTTDEEARTALEQGRVDAYAIDETMQLGSMVRNPGVYRIAGEAFGPEDNYGIGLPLGSDGVDFVNAWLDQIEADGTWAELYQIAIGDRANIDTVPEPPAIGA